MEHLGRLDTRTVDDAEAESDRGLVASEISLLSREGGAAMAELTCGVGMRRKLRPGGNLVLRARATSFPGHQYISWSILRRVEYALRSVASNGKVVNSTELQIGIGLPADPKVKHSTPNSL